jgi:hypothetical protein
MMWSIWVARGYELEHKNTKQVFTNTPRTTRDEHEKQHRKIVTENTGPHVFDFDRPYQFMV